MIQHVQIEVTMLLLKLRQSVSSGVTTGQRKCFFKARQTLIFGFLYIQFNFFLIIKFYFWTFSLRLFYFIYSKHQKKVLLLSPCVSLSDHWGCFFHSKCLFDSRNWKNTSLLFWLLLLLNRWSNGCPRVNCCLLTSILLHTVPPGLLIRGRQGEEQENWPSTVCRDLLGYQMVARPTWGEQARHWAPVSPLPLLLPGRAERPETRLILDVCQGANQCSRSRWKQNSQLLFLFAKQQHAAPILEIIRHCSLISPSIVRPPLVSPPPRLSEQIQISFLLFFLLFVFPNQIVDVFSSEIVLVQDWRKQEDSQQDISLCTLCMVWSEIKSCVVCSVKACVHVQMSSARSVWQAWKTCLALLGHKWMFDG